MDDIFNTYFGGGYDSDEGNFIGGDDEKYSIDNAEFEASDIYYTFQYEDDPKKRFQKLQSITGSSELEHMENSKIYDGIMSGKIIGVSKINGGKKIYYKNGGTQEVSDPPKFDMPKNQTYGTDVNAIAKNGMQYLGKKRKYEKQISSI